MRGEGGWEKRVEGAKERCFNLDCGEMARCAGGAIVVGTMTLLFSAVAVCREQFEIEVAKELCFQFGEMPR